MRPKSIFEVAPGVLGLRTAMVNLFFISSPLAPKSWVLVDGGLRGYGNRVYQIARQRFGKNNPPQAIVLTHGHFDHTGTLPWLLQRWPVPVYAHRDELPFLNERLPYSPPDPSVGGGLMALSSPLYPRRASKLDITIAALPEGGSVPALPDWEWIPTPGHSPGHVSLWRPSDGVLIAGDAIVTTRQESALSVWSQKIEVRPPPAYFTPDWRAAYTSMRRLRALNPVVLATGHGQPVSGSEWRRELDALIDQFPERGLPRHGRYVRTTWTDPVHA